MNWKIVWAFALVGYHVQIQAEEPAATPKKPQWQRMLTGEDAKLAAEYDRQANITARAGKVKETVEVMQKVVELRERVQGADHWQTIQQRYTLEMYQRSASLSPEDRKIWDEAIQAYAEAEALEPTGNYNEAGVRREKVARVIQKYLGENHSFTAACIGKLAQNLFKRGLYAESQQQCEKSIEIFLKTLGREHPFTAAAYLSLAKIYMETGRPTEAEPIIRDALRIYRETHGDNHPDTATVYVQLADNLGYQFRDREAEPLYRKAAEVCEKTLSVGSPQTIFAIAGHAMSLHYQGRSGESEEILAKGLQLLGKKLGYSHPEAVTVYQKAGLVMIDRGRYAEAEVILRKSFQLAEITLGSEHPWTVSAQGQLARALSKLGRHAEAETLYRQAIAREKQARGADSTTHHELRNNYAMLLMEVGRNSEAEAIYRDVLATKSAKRGESHPSLAFNYNNLANCLIAQNKLQEARPAYRKAAELSRTFFGPSHPWTSAVSVNLAKYLMIVGETDAALEAIKQAAASFEEARLLVPNRSGDSALLGDIQSPYPVLAAIHLKAGRPEDAWNALEANLARSLLDDKMYRRQEQMSPEEQREWKAAKAEIAKLAPRIQFLVMLSNPNTSEREELKRLLAQQTELSQKVTRMSVSFSQQEIAGLKDVQQALPEDTALIYWLDLSNKAGTLQEHWGCVVRRNQPPRWERLTHSQEAGRWNPADESLPADLATAISKSLPMSEIRTLTEKLNRQRLSPLEPHLEGIKKLLVVPSGAMAGVPIETIAKQFQVSYIPSGSILSKLQRPHEAYPRRLLAVGNPVFPARTDDKRENPIPEQGLLILQVLPGGAADGAQLLPGDILLTYAGTELTSQEQLLKLVAEHGSDESVQLKIWRDGETSTLVRSAKPGRLGVAVGKRPQPEMVAQQRRLDSLASNSARGGSWSELPGTAVEIAQLVDLFQDRAKTLTRRNANPSQLDELRKLDQMKLFGYLHFATHGEADQSRPFESSLILAPARDTDGTPSSANRAVGRLTASEILTSWELDASLVTLSACETGIGRRAGGDGMLGFAHAFLSVGARTVCLSLWKVDDTATSLLMTRFYQNLLGQRDGLTGPMKKMAALDEAKRWLQNLSADDVNRLKSQIANQFRGKNEDLGQILIPTTPPSKMSDKPFAHPAYWAAFILIGDPN